MMMMSSSPGLQGRDEVAGEILLEEEGAWPGAFVRGRDEGGSR